MTGVGEKYTCERCGGVFIKKRSDEEAQAEYREESPNSYARGDEEAIICHDCWVAFMAWAKEQGIQL